MSGGPFGLSEDELDDRVAYMLDAQRRASAVRVLGDFLRVTGDEDEEQLARVVEQNAALQTGSRFMRREWPERDQRYVAGGRRRR
jgi:hypothetical protein